MGGWGIEVQRGKYEEEKKQDSERNEFHWKLAQ